MDAEIMNFAMNAVVKETKKKVVLLVEDDLMIRDAYQEALQHAGYLVDVAATGEESLAKLKVNKPDLILLDVFLPKVSGFDIIDKVKENAEFAHIPIIVISNVFVDREELAKKGVSYSLIKSDVDPGQIAKKVEDALITSTKK